MELSASELVPILFRSIGDSIEIVIQGFVRDIGGALSYYVAVQCVIELEKMGALPLYPAV